jgi:CheY-like chemotaxis protein
MKTAKQIKIVILEDNEFYNAVLTKQLQNFTEGISHFKKIHFDIQSFTYAQDCIRNLKEDVDIVFSDYYLGNGVTASDVLEQIKNSCIECKFVVLSQTSDEIIIQGLLNKGAFAVLHKDKDSLSKSCMVIEEILDRFC